MNSFLKKMVNDIIFTLFETFSLDFIKFQNFFIQERFVFYLEKCKQVKNFTQAFDNIIQNNCC